MSVDNEALNTVIKKLNNSYQIWLIVGICQIVFGFWYVTPIFFGAWNIYCAVNRKKLAAAFPCRSRGYCQELEGQHSRVHYPQCDLRCTDRCSRLRL